MRRWRECILEGFCLVGVPALAMPEPPPNVPRDFLSTFRAVDAAYGHKDIPSILRCYAPNCIFIVVTPTFQLEHKNAEPEPAKGKAKMTRRQYDVAWQRSELKQLFFVTRQPFEKPASLPLQTISVTSDIQKFSLNRQATELRLTVARKMRSHQGQVQGVQNEVDEEIWSKGVQGWKLKRRIIHPKGGWTDFS